MARIGFELPLAPFALVAVAGALTITAVMLWANRPRPTDRGRLRAITALAILAIACLVGAFEFW